jgi:tripartite-type tricarboxylate transporter receptor subunit TctC
MKSWLHRLGLTALALAMLHSGASAETYPSKTVTIVVPLAASGGMDFIARTIGQRLSERTGQPVLVENRPGGGTVVAAVAVAHAPPDGYTLLLVPGSTLTTNATVYKKLPYDPRHDFVPIALTSHAPSRWWSIPACRRIRCPN